MTTISSKEFATHQDRYFDMAISDDVRIKRRRNMYRLVYEPIVEEQIVLESDDDLRRAITGDELLAGIYEDLETFDNDLRRAITMDEFKKRALLIVDKLDKKYANK